MRGAFPAFAMLVTALALPVAAHDGGPSITPERQEAIVRLLEASGQTQLMKQAMVSMIDQMRPSMPSLPDEFFDEFKKAALTDELVDLLVPVMDRHYSDEEIRGLTEFFESPLGRTLVAKQPLIQQDAMGVGQRWGERKAMEIMQRLREQGVPPSEDAGPE